MIRPTAVVVRAALLVALWLGGVGVAWAQFTLDFSGWTAESQYDDLQALEQVPASERLEVPYSVAPDHGELVSLPLRATLVAFDAATYRFGDSFVYDLLLENIGAVPFDFPQSLQQSSFRRGMAAARAAKLTLYFVDTAGSHIFIGSPDVFGASDVPGSLLRLEPGQSVVVRLRAQWGANYFPSNWTSGNVTARAKVMVYHVNQDYAPVVSVNTQTVQISR